MAYRALRVLKVLQKESITKSFTAQTFRQLTLSNARYSSELSEQKLMPDVEFRTETNIVYPSDPDRFGTLSGIWSREVPEDEGDLKEEEFLQNKPLNSQKLTTKQYADLIKQYVQHRRLKEALNVLEVKMLKEDQVKPENYIYSLLIDACADVGYTKKAFKLYNDVKRRQLKVTGDMYTSLFNACANSPWPDDGLKNAKHLRELLKEKGIELNLTNYNAMIKAFGHCKDLSTAFQIVDEMISKKIKIRVHTFNFLLQACISDKENGLRHAVIVWRKMLLRREKPNIYSFNLMLKCVKECNFGSKEDIMEAMCLLAKSEPIKQVIERNVERLQLESNNEIDKDSTLKTENIESHFQANNQTETHLVQIEFLNKNSLSSIKSDPVKNVPNLLSKNLQIGEVISLQEVNSPAEKFSFIGGLTGFLQEMKEYNVKPDIKTVTQLLGVIEDNKKAEDELMCLMRDLEIRGDIDFYNTLMRKRCFRNDYDDALVVRGIIEEENRLRKKKHPMKKHIQLRLNLLTYGALAMTCATKEEAQKLLAEMREKQLKINIEILGTMLRSAIHKFNFGYVIYILHTAQEELLKVNYIFRNHLKKFNETCEKLRKKDEQGKRKASATFLKAHGIYLIAYQKWLEEMKAAGAFETQHMWRQFNETQPETVQRQNLIQPPKRYVKLKKRRVPAYRV